MQIAALFETLLREPVEAEWLEFKEAKHDFSVDELGRYFSALTNETNLLGRDVGWIVFGVSNRPPRHVVGTQFRRTPESLQRLKQEIAQNLAPSMSFHDIIEYTHGPNRVLLLGIPPAPRGVPVAWKGHYYGRHGESLAPLSLAKLDRIRAQASASDWTAAPVPLATLNDLDADALRVARHRFGEKYPDLAAEAARWNDQQLLRKLRLLAGEHLTRAALILLGARESAALLRPGRAQLTWVLRDADGADRDYAHFEPPLLLATEALFTKVRNLTYRYLPLGTLIPTEVPQYDAWVMREALHNCIAHQDYTLGGKINVVEKPDELLFSNLGGFLPGSVENAVERDAPPEHYRNPCLASAMFDLKLIDTRGGGIRRMFREQRSRFFPLPEYTLDARAQRVEVRLYGKFLDENYSHALMARDDLTLHEVILLDRVQKGRPVNAGEIRQMRARELVEGRAPRLIISASVARMTQQEPAYIRNRGFDDAYYMDLIEGYLTRFHTASRHKLDELLLDKLPERLDEAQRRRRVSYLLTKLRQAGRIRNTGSDRTPCWMLSKPVGDAPP